MAPKAPTDFEYSERVDLFRGRIQEAIDRREGIVQGEGLLSVPITVEQAEQINREAKLLKCVWEEFKNIFEV